MDASNALVQRHLGAALETALADTPVVCLLGPRQSGKSTLVRSLAPNRPYLDLDEEALHQTARDDPGGFVRSLPRQVTLDEIQRAPELLRAIKVAVDADRTPGRFILTGSANLLLLPRASESLAGRMEILHLHPLTEAEREAKPGGFLRTLLDGGFSPRIRQATEAGSEELTARMIRGGYPGIRNYSLPRARQWHLNYLRSLFEKDVLDIDRIRNPGRLHTLLAALAHRSGGLLNRSTLSRELGMDRETVNHYVEVLERLFLVRLLPAWHPNRGKRLVKSPKPHLLDTGIAATLMDLAVDEWNSRRHEFGHLLESFVVQQLMAQAGWTEPSLGFYHYRDRDQVEVDLVITKGNRVWGVEVKAARSVGQSDLSGLRRVAERAGTHFQYGMVLYTGNSILSLDQGRFLAVPISKLWEL